ncbi:hypothetical protein ACTFIW_012892 [Dictyostelium discoideum]
MNSEFSVGLSNTISSLFKDDEDYQIVQASELLTYLSNKGFYPPLVIQNIMIDILESERSNDPAVVYNIIKVLNSLKDEGYYIELENWDLIISVFISLNIHLSRPNSSSSPIPPPTTTTTTTTTTTSGGERAGKRLKTESSPTLSSSSSSLATSSRGVNTVSDSVAKIPFLSSKVLATYFISIYESMNIVTSSFTDSHPLHRLFKVGNRAHILFSEVMSIIDNCDHDTLREMSKFVTLIYRGGKSWEDSILPSISQGFRNIKRCYRRALFCQLMPFGDEKTKLLKGMLEYFYPTGSGNEFVGFNKRKRGGSKELIEELTPWFKKISTKAIKHCSKTPSSDDQFYDGYNYHDNQNDDNDTNFLNLESPIGEIEVFVIMICQLYQSTIISSTKEYGLKLKNQVQNKQQQQQQQKLKSIIKNEDKNEKENKSENEEKEKEKEEGEDDDGGDQLPYQVPWQTVYEQFKEFSKTILTTCEKICKNRTLIESNLNGVETILKFKSTP